MLLLKIYDSLQALFCSSCLGYSSVSILESRHNELSVSLTDWYVHIRLGVYEIGYAIEDPFQGSLRLSILCDTIRRDVLADERLRATAFDLEEKVDDLVEEEEEGETVSEIESSENMTNQTDTNGIVANGAEMEEIMEAIETITTGATSKNGTQPYQ